MRVVVKMRMAAGVLLAVWLSADSVSAEETADRRHIARPPVYQRQRQLAPPAHSSRLAPAHAERSRGPARHAAPGRHFHPQPAPPNPAHGAWFQRPYPYHLDYYRLRYGGTYEPYYSGGLYGTPQVAVPPAFGYGYPYAYGYGQPLQTVPDSTAPPEHPSAR